MELRFNSLEEVANFARTCLGLSDQTTAPVTPAAPVAPPVAPVAPTITKTYTKDELINASIPLVDSHLAELQALMNKYGIASINDLQESQFGAFAADLRTLGGAI